MYDKKNCMVKKIRQFLFLGVIFILSPSISEGANIINFSNPINNNLYFIDARSIQRENSYIRYQITTNYAVDEIQALNNQAIRSSQMRVIIDCKNSLYRILSFYGFNQFGAHGKKIPLDFNRSHLLAITDLAPYEVRKELVCFN
jgi:hypothetical protein